MRRVTRNLNLGILAVLVLLLALGALSGLFGSSDPYDVTAAPADDVNVARNGTLYRVAVTR